MIIFGHYASHRECEVQNGECTIILIEHNANISENTSNVVGKVLESSSDCPEPLPDLLCCWIISILEILIK